jgi:Family of unknown function (DUF6492)
MAFDIVIPFHPKDGDLLPWCVQGVRRHLDAARILGVTAASARPLVEAAGATFVDEDSVVEGVTAASVKQKGWGWYFQQILKFGMAAKVQTDYFACVDADTVFLNDVELIDREGRPQYATGTEYHRPYFDTFQEMMGFPAQREYSFIVHHMIFNRRLIEELIGQMRPRSPWYENITALAGNPAPDGSTLRFSEYETYGHYLKAKHPEELNIRPLKWTNLAVAPSERLLGRLGKRYDYCSFHAYARPTGAGPARRLLGRARFELKLLLGR